MDQCYKMGGIGKQLKADGKVNPEVESFFQALC